jgi:predicted phosphodiesterase
MRSASRWPSEHNWDLLHEYKVANDELKKLSDLNSLMDCFWLEGNHDNNLLAVGRVKQDLRSLLDYSLPQYEKVGGKAFQVNEHFLGKWVQKATYQRSRSKGCLRIGATFFKHGYEAGVSADEMEAIYWGQNWANSLTIGGHTHRPTEGAPRQAMKSKKRGLPFWYLNAGCSCDMARMDYMDRLDREQWGNGFVRGWSEPVQSPRLRPSWDAECVVTKWFEE